MNNYGVLAIDLAKTVFQVCKTDSFGNVIYNKAVNRKRLKEILTLENNLLLQWSHVLVHITELVLRKLRGMK